MDTLTPLIVKNLDDNPITIGWNNHFVTIPPGEARTAQFDAVVNYFGDPRSIEAMHSNKDDAGLVSWIPDRASERRRLQCKWGNTFAQDESKVFGPNVEVTTLEGERIWTVLEDPQGQHSSPTLIAAGHQADLEAQIETMRRQLDTLTRMKENDELPTTHTAEEIPSDENPTSRRGSRIQGKAAQDDN